MWVLETVAVAFALYSALPTPQPTWNERNMRYALAAFPMVGAALGALWWGVCALCAMLDAPDILRAGALCVLPALVTGGIHLDGYADVSDALASHAAPERMREILRDPHVGAFAVIRLCVYFAAYFALCAAVEPTLAVAAIFVLSRALSALALTLLPVAEGSSMAKAFVRAADKRRVRVLACVEAVVSAAAMLYFGGLGGAAAVCAALVVLWRYARVARKLFGGTSGDLAGWFVVRAEFWMLAVLVAVRLGGWRL